MKRWLIRLSILLLILLISALVAAHFVLKGDLPRRIVVDILREQTGLRVDAGAMSVTWSGRTVIEDLEIGLPIEQDPFLTARRVRVRHNSLIALVLTRSLGLSDLRIVDPVVSLEAAEGEQWNLIEAADIVSLALARNADPNAPSRSLPELPRLRIERAIVDVRLPDGRELSYQPFVILGDPDGTLAWDFALTLEDRIALGGRVSPGAGWAHRIDFAVDEVRSLIEPFVDTLPYPLDAAGAWRGDIRSGTLAGTLTVDRLHAGEYTAKGSISADLVGTRFNATPTSLTVQRTTTNAEQTRTDQLRITGGTISADLDAVTATRIIGSLATAVGAAPATFAEFQAEAEYSIPQTSGSAKLDWRGNAQPLTGSALEHTGSLLAVGSVSPLGEVRIDTDLRTTGRGEPASWDIVAAISAAGPSTQQLSISTIAERARVSTAQGQANLDRAQARLTARWPVFSDIRLSIPDADPERTPLVINAALDASTLDWTASADAQQYRPPLSIAALPEPPPFTVSLRAAGDRSSAVLETLSAESEGIALRADGRIALDDLNAEVRIVAERGPLAVADSVATASTVISADITGTVSPLDLRLVGQTEIEAPTYRQRPIGDISSRFSASANNRAIEFVFEPFTILDGRVSAIASYATGDAEARIAFLGEGVSLDRVGDVLGIPLTLTGEVGADLAATIPLQNPASTVASGTWTAARVNAADLALINGEGTLIAGNGSLRLPQITLRHADGSLQGAAEMDLERPDRFHAVFSLSDWPLDLEAQQLAVNASGQADLVFQLAPFGADGTAQLDADLRFRDQPASTLTIRTSVSGRDLSIDTISADALGGTVNGSGLVPLSAEFWDRARFDLAWADLDFTGIARFAPQLQPLQGTATGSLSVSKADGPRDELPLKLVLKSDFDNARFSDFTLGTIDREEADLDLTAHIGPDRLEIKDGSIVAAGGVLDLYGRISDHDGEPAAFVSFSMNDLDLQQIASAASLNDRPMPGRVSGEGSIGGSLTSPHRLFGSATMMLSESDLLALPGIAQLYSALRLNIGTPKPEGEGQVLIRLEGQSLEITRLLYFNRGTDVVAALTIEDIFNPTQSAIEGTAVGSIRPLRAGSQSFLSVIDRLLRAAQANAAAVDISGTLTEPQTRLTPLKDLTSSIRRLLRGSTN